ncbi:zinc finger, CCHC-type containing protein [Tanacetum coccineum]
MVEHNNSTRYNDNKGKHKYQDTKTYPYKKSKVTCWKCGKSEHLKKDCKGGNVGNKANGSGINGSVDGSTNSLNSQNMFNKSFQVYYVTYVSEAYFVQDDDVAWWVNSGATVHVCKDRCWFKTYESLKDGSIIYMGNESTALVHGRSCVDLRFSSEKIVYLFNVLHVPNIRKNLDSSSVLNNCGYKQVIESNKFLLSKHGVFIGFGYLSNQMFRLNIVNDNIGSAYMSTSKLNDSILWHARLGHVHYKRIQDMSKNGLIPAFDMDTEMCKSCMLMKITKKPFQNVKRETKVLELIHNNLCNLDATPSLGNKKYFVTFIDDASRFCYVYLLHSKDEALDKFKVFKTKVELQQGSLIKRFRTDRKPNLNYLKAWGCEAVLRPPDPKLKALGERGIEYIFVGYAKHSKAFRFSLVPRPSLNISNGTKDIGRLVVLEEVTKEDFAFWKEAINDEMDSRLQTSWLQVDLQKKTKVACISTIRLLIAIASIHNLIIHQMDVNTTLLNGELDEERSPKQWHQKFDEVVLSSGYLLNQANKCEYSKFDKTGKGVIIFLYVDNMLIFDTDQVQVNLTKKFLSSKFSMKDIGEADVILGIRIKHESNGIAISQSHYIEKVLKKFNYFDCTPVSTPIDTSEKPMPNNGQDVSQLEYSRVIGCLMYAMTCTRPDIAFAAGKQSRYTILLGTQHWQAIQRASKKNTCITGSTMESEFVPLAAAGKVAIWLGNLIFEILLWSKPIAPISILCDSASTLAKVYSQMYNGKSRHLGVRYSMIRELITNGVVSIEFVMSQRNLADHLTKRLARDFVLNSAKGMGLKYVTPPKSDRSER